MVITSHNLYEFVHLSKGRVNRFLTLAMSSFFEDIAVENNLEDLNQVMKFLGNELFNAVYPCALEYFYSNNYIVDDDLKSWNVIDAFLKKDGMLLEPADKDYLQALKNSYMSIYEVVDFELNKSITLQNLIEKKEKPITISEKKLTHQIVKWDKLGIRIVHLKDGIVQMAGGGLPLTSHIAEEAINVITTINKKMKSLYKNDKAQEFLMKKVWVKEICYSYLKFYLNTRNINIREMIRNQDGHKLQFCTIHFKIEKDKNDVIKTLNFMSELQLNESKESEHRWTWIQDNKNGESIIFAEVEIKGNNLTAKTNSEERAVCVKQILEKSLSQLVSTGLISMDDMDQLIKTHQQNKDTTSHNEEQMPKEVEQKIITEYKDEYYKKWINMSLPILNGKSPKQSSQTKMGKEKLTALLKELENREIRDAMDRKVEPYNIDWLRNELGIEV